MTAFLLSCECSAEVAVTAGQAGGSTLCPRCGRVLSVPKLRDLEHLRREDRGQVVLGKSWRPAHGVALLGAIVAAVSWLAGLWLTSGPVQMVVDERSLRSAVLAADDLEIYRVWSQALSHAGVRRPPADGEQAILRRARFVEGVSGVLHVVTAGAALAAVGAALVLWTGKRTSLGPSAAASPE